MRLFFAVPVSEQVRSAVHSAVDMSPLRSAPWRWIPVENYHLTLKFLGEAEEDLLTPLCEAAGRAAAGCSPFDISYGSFGGFPDLKRPRVLFYSLSSGTEQLARIARRIESEIGYLGFEREKRRFRAHLTLARVKRPIDGATAGRLADMPSLPDGTVDRVDRFVLMRSVLQRSGAVYSEVAAFGLEG